eukprot:803377-Prorocentrum_minimum.AAC.1
MSGEVNHCPSSGTLYCHCSSRKPCSGVQVLPYLPHPITPPLPPISPPLYSLFAWNPLPAPFPPDRARQAPSAADQSANFRTRLQSLKSAFSLLAFQSCRLRSLTRPTYALRRSKS